MIVIELSDMTIFCKDIKGIYIDKSYYSPKYYLITIDRTCQITRDDYEKIKSYLLSLNYNKEGEIND